jgi:hypothetical protein
VKPWSNIELSHVDHEVTRIDNLEINLGEIPENVWQIRELITGFEVCHFKYRKHIQYILESIRRLKPNKIPNEIGSTHIRHGANTWEKDNSGRSLKGLQYIQALKCWLSANTEIKDKVPIDPELNRHVLDWLGHKDPEKIRLVRLLIARMTWDWKSYEKYRTGHEGDPLEFQVCRMDICHYNFPGNMDSVIRAIGQLKPVQGFEGCGSCTSNIKLIVEKEIVEINRMLESISKEEIDADQWTRSWLLSSLAKTLKEQAGSAIPVHIII